MHEIFIKLKIVTNIQLGTTNFLIELIQKKTMDEDKIQDAFHSVMARLCKQHTDAVHKLKSNDQAMQKMGAFDHCNHTGYLPCFSRVNCKQFLF